MLTWLLVNIPLTVLALLFIGLNRTAPHRLRFHAGFAAMLAWLIPWQLLAPIVPKLFEMGLWPVEQQLVESAYRSDAIPLIIMLATGVPLVPDTLIFTPFTLLFLTLCAIGFVLFVWNLSSHYNRLRKLAGRSKNGDWLWRNAGLNAEVPITVQQEIAGAFSSGIWRPRIWIHQALTLSPQLPTLLQHELTHIKQHDNYYLWFITLVEKMFWWNPLVWLLGNRTREMQELSCDEKCHSSMSDYPSRLAELMRDCALLGENPEEIALSANIFNNPNPNVKRIKLLERSYHMKPRHFISTTMTLLAAVSTIGFVTAQTSDVEVKTEKRVVVVKHIGGDGDSTGNLHELHKLPELGELPELIELHELHGLHGLSELSELADGAQFIRIMGRDGEQQISFSFADANLVTVLSPLAELGMHTQMLSTHTTQVAGQSGVQHAVKTVVRQRHEAGTGMPASKNLKLEFAGAADRLVTVSGENLSLQEALAVISDASQCNIFQDADSIVVDHCVN